MHKCWNLSKRQVWTFENRKLAGTPDTLSAEDKFFLYVTLLFSSILGQFTFQTDFVQYAVTVKYKCQTNIDWKSSQSLNKNYERLTRPEKKCLNYKKEICPLRREKNNLKGLKSFVLFSFNFSLTHFINKIRVFAYLSQLNLVVLVMTLHKMHSTAALKPDSSRHDNLRSVRLFHAGVFFVGKGHGVWMILNRYVWRIHGMWSFTAAPCLMCQVRNFKVFELKLKKPLEALELTSPGCSIEREYERNDLSSIKHCTKAGICVSFVH